jgi:peptidoglycan/xylan/chitin deacetylase (PgdA/CDA1 family)
MRSPFHVIPSIILASILLVACTENSEARLIRASTSSSATSSAAAAKARRAERLTEAASRPKSSINPVVPGVPLTTYRVPILVYHHIRAQQGWAKTTWSWKMTVTPQTFERHMQWLVDKGYETLTLSELTSAIHGERTMPKKPIVITFDDNNLSQYDVAAPIMDAKGQKGVFFLIAKYLDSPTMVNKERALDLLSRGHQIASHTMTHRALPGLNDADTKWELEESKRVFEELTGNTVKDVSYPGTAHNQRVRDATKAAGYETATIMDPRYVTHEDDWMKWPRIMMTDDTDLTKVLP